MALSDAFLGDAAAFNIWIAARTDGGVGSGTAKDPFNGFASQGAMFDVLLSYLNGAPQEARVNTGSRAHGLVNGDVVAISGVSGSFADNWNGFFGIYEVTEYAFRYFMKKALPPDQSVPGFPRCSRLTFPFDEIMRMIPPNMRIHLGPGTYQTRGFGTDGSGAMDERGFQVKSGWKITGAGLGVTTLQLVGADRADYHYHALGMPVEPTGITAIAPLERFEVSDLTIDCNMDSQPGRPSPGYAAVACGALRLFGNQSRVSRVKATNWGTKSFKQGCFVISILQASGRPSGADAQPIITETAHSGIEDCIAIEPSKESVRETTVLHLGGLKNSTNHAQGFGRAPFIRRNFVDGGFKTNDTARTPFSSAFITSKNGTQIAGLGKFVGKRALFRTATDVGTYVRFYNPNDTASKWNGYFPIAFKDSDDTIRVDLASTQGTSNDSSLVIMGTEFRAIAVTSCEGAVVEGNHVYNCWIGGPYASPLDDSVNQPTAPPTLAREERLDPFNALNTRSLMVRNNFYKNVAVGPYWNMGGVSGAVTASNISYSSGTGVVTVTTARNHKLWVNARVKVEFPISQPNYDGLREILAVTDTTFQYQALPGLAVAPSGTASYRVVSGIDYLTIDGNIIELADLDETEFAIKEYPLPASATTQTYRPFGIVVGDNGISALAGPHAHRQVFIRNNKIRYVNANKGAGAAGLGRPGGGGMQLAGIKQLHVTYNVIDVNLTADNKLRTFRCGTTRFFHNTRPDGEFITGWNGDANRRYDEPESFAEDAFILSLLNRRRR